MTDFEHDRIVPDEKSGKDKTSQVAEMFNDIAPKYDFLNRFLSLGIDKGWRRKAVAKIGKANPSSLLDVATGTGDMAILAAEKLHLNRIEGIDISEGMLEIGRKKIAAKNFSKSIHLSVGDSANIQFTDNEFDAATVAFGVRNFAHLEKGLSEINRVLKPGGQLVILEFSRPKNVLFKKLYNFYMQVVTPNAGGFFSRNKKAYSYLNESVMAFPERENFVNILKNCGFKEANFKPLTLGVCCIYTGWK